MPIPYKCEWCGAAAARNEKMACLSRHTVLRGPRHYRLRDELFSEQGNEAMFHEHCLIQNSKEILERLYDGLLVELPKKRKAAV